MRLISGEFVSSAIVPEPKRRFRERVFEVKM
jgi:hypothetical protein